MSWVHTCYMCVMFIALTPCIQHSDFWTYKVDIMTLALSETNLNSQYTALFMVFSIDHLHYLWRA